MKKTHKYILLFLGIFVFINLSFTFSKFISSKLFNLGYHLVGAKYDASNLVKSDVSLIPSRELLVNPYRGFYILDGVSLPAYANDSAIDDANRQQILEHAESTVRHLNNDSLSLGLIEISLSNYKTTEIPEYYLNVLNDYLDIYRKAGYKAIIRFAYGDEYREGEDIQNEPDDFELILKHLDQLKSFFETNKDVIHVVQLGFIGPWGEMHSSPYANSEYIKRLVDKALTVIPYPMQVSLRRPKFYRQYIGSDAFFDEKLRYTDTKEARIGIFNDSFLSSKSDKGTYDSDKRESELEWQSYLTKYTVSGGELSYSGVDGQYGGDTEELFFEIPEAIHNMSKVHTNYLHDSNKVIEAYWKSIHLTSSQDAAYEGLDAYTYFANRIGYRYLVTDAKVPGNAIAKGGIINFETTIKNEGFGNLIQKRKVYVILTKGDRYYKVLTDKDPTTWWSGEETREEFVLKIPSNIQEGEWKIYLSLPDEYDTYANNENAAIKFANEDIFLSQILGNYIGTVNIQGEAQNNNNGFYQLNDADETVVDNSPLYKYSRPITLDGLITDEYEWYESELIYDDGDVEVYAREDDQYIYFLGQAHNFNVFDYHFHIHFALHDPEFYDYMTEDERIYNGSFENKTSIDRESRTDIDLAQQEYFEYRIPKERIQIKSIRDIIKLRVEYLDEHWNKKLSVDVNDFKPAYSIVVDGMNTNGEWKEEDLVFQDTNSKIYARQDGGYLFIYVDTSLVTNMSNYYAYLYLAGNNSANPTDYNRTLTRSKIYEGNITDINDKKAISVYDYMIDEGIEYKIHIKDVDAESISDIIGSLFILKNKKTNKEAVRIESEFDRSNFSSIKIDGYNDDWSEDYVYDETSKYKTYLGGDRNFLYFYGEILNELASDYEHIDIYFAIKDKSSSFNDYIYELHDNEFMTYNSHDQYNVISDYAKTKGVEFKIPLTYLGIKDAEEIIGIKIKFHRMNADGQLETVYEFELNPNFDTNIVIDGANTAGEYDGHLLVSSDNYDIYGLTTDTNLFIFGTYKKITFADMYLYIATKDAKTGDYNFRIKNTSSSIHRYDGGEEGETVSSLLSTAVTDNSFEFSLPLSDIGIEFIDDLKGLKIRPRYLDDTETKQDYYQHDIILDEKIIIDGENSEYSNHLIASNKSFDVYSFSGKDYLYVYAYFKDVAIDNFQVYFATEHKLDYNYRIENGTLRLESSKENINTNLFKTITSNVVEYAIPLTNLNITKLDDLKSIRLKPLIVWDAAYTKDIFDIPSSIIIDGEVNDNEFTSENLIGSVDGVELYMRRIEDFVTYSIKFDPEAFTTPRKKYTIYMCTASGCSTASRLARLENGRFRLLSNEQSLDKSNYGYNVNPYIEGVYLFSDMDFDISEVKYYEIRLEDENGEDRKTFVIQASTTFSGLG